MQKDISVIFVVALLVGFVILAYTLHDPKSELPPAPSATVQDEALIEEEIQEPLNDSMILTGGIHFTLTDLDMTKEDVDLARINGLTFEIVNSMDREYKPVLQLFIYDDNDIVQFRSMPQGSYNIGDFSPGPSQPITVYPDHGFNDLNTTKTIQFRFKEGQSVIDFEYPLNVTKYFAPRVSAEDQMEDEETQVPVKPAFNMTLVEYDAVQRSANFSALTKIRINVTNTKDVAMDYVVQVFLFGDNDDDYFHRVPRESFEFDAMAPHETRTLTYAVDMGYNGINETKTFRLRLLDPSKTILEENNGRYRFYPGHNIPLEVEERPSPSIVKVYSMSEDDDTVWTFEE